MTERAQEKKTQPAQKKEGNDNDNNKKKPTIRPK